MRIPGSVIGAAAFLFLLGIILIAEGSGMCVLAVSPNPNDPARPEQEPRFAELAFFGADAVFGLLLVGSGIGVLRLKRTARITAFVTTGCQLLKSAAIALVATLFFVWVLGQPFGFFIFFATMLWLAVMVVALGFMGLCVPVIILLNLRSARMAFAVLPIRIRRPSLTIGNDMDRGYPKRVAARSQGGD